jgi:hypothetical protein
MPRAEGGQPTAALGGAQLAINAFSAHPAQAYALVEYLTAAPQMLERAREAGQFPARPILYRGALGNAPSVTVVPDAGLSLVPCSAFCSRRRRACGPCGAAARGEQSSSARRAAAQAHRPFRGRGTTDTGRRNHRQ